MDPSQKKTDQNPQAQPAVPALSAAEAGSTRQRRSSRVTIAIPVVVYGKGPDQNIFVENVTTMVVNAHGGKLTMRSPVNRQDTVVLKNPRTGVEAKCRMVYLRDSLPGHREAAVEFIDPAPRFWGIAFPPADWDKSSRRLPRETQGDAN